MHLKDLGNLENVSKIISNVFDNFGKITRGNFDSVVAELASGLNDCSLESIKLATTQMELTKVQAKAIFTTKGLKDEELEQAISTATLSASQKGATATTGGLSTAFKGLAASLGISTAALGALIAGFAVLTLGTVALKANKQHLEELHQETVRAASDFQTASNSIDSYISRYQDLHTALLQAKGNEEETYNIKKQLLDLQTELNDQFGDEYGKVNLVTDAYRDQTEVLKEYNKEAARELLNSTDPKGISLIHYGIWKM